MEMKRHSAMNVVGASSAIVIPMTAVVVMALAWGRALAAGFVALITLLLATSMLVAVHHGEVVAYRFREPYASLLLAVVVTVIEVALIVTLDCCDPTRCGNARTGHSVCCRADCL
jgi:Ca2+/H+ antiporter